MSFEQLNYLLEGSGIPGATLSVLMFFGLLLSPFPRFLLVLGAIRVGFRGFPAGFICVGLAFVLALSQISPLIVKINQKLVELSPDRVQLTPTKANEFLSYTEKEWLEFVRVHTDPVMKERVEKVLPDRGETGLLLAFSLGELQQGMKIALLVLLPLLVIDLLTATALSALGVESLSAELVSFPLKVALILSTSGWTLIGENLLKSYV
jgi:flagellar biosynthetic protein FliP